MKDVMTLFGRDMVYWQSIQLVLAKHGVDGAEHLDSLLSAKKDEGRVDVLDGVNQDRLLGTIQRPDMRGHSYQMFTYEPARLYFDPTEAGASAEVSVVSLTAAVKRGPNPLDVRGVLTTFDPLNRLLKLPDFRLPGETTEQAEHRRWAW